MSDWIDDPTGDDWEEYCRSLLRYRYTPVDVQGVPTGHGDLGIDYWIRGSGDIYQCYGTEYGDTPAERLRLQKKKLQDEVRKLKNNADQISAMIAPAKCRRYVFLVPRYDSRKLLEYAATKTAELVALKLPFCADDFEIVVHCLDDFSVERSQLQAAHLSVPRLMQDDPDGQMVHDWLSDNGELARTIREKLEAIHPSKGPEGIDSLVHHTVAGYLCGEDALTSLQKQYPDLHLRVMRVVTTRRKRLQLIGGRTSEVPLDALVQEVDHLKSDLTTEPVGLDSSEASTLASGTVARWLADCTFDPR